MEEKTNFSYEANMKLSVDIPTVEPPVEDYRILYMSNLQPMSVKWQTKDGNRDSLLVFLDFFEEVVYDLNFKKLNETNLGKAILEVLHQKKANAVKSHLPDEAVEKIFNTKQQVYDERPDARTIQI